MVGRPLLLALLLAALSSTAPAIAAAAEPVAAAPATTAQEMEARAHFVAGEDAYARGRWREALREFELGYALSPRPEFLINFAQAHRKLGEYDAAARECRRYLATSPPAGLAAQAERLLAQIEEERAHAPSTSARPTNMPSTNMPSTNTPSTNTPSTNTPSTNATTHVTTHVTTNATTTKTPTTNAPTTNAPVTIQTQGATGAPVLVATPSAPPKRRRAWIAPVVVAGVVVVAAAVTLGLVFGLPANDSFKPTPLGTVDFR